MNLNVTLKEDSLTLNLESGPNSYKIEEGPSNKDLQDQKYKEAGRPCTNRLKKMQIVTDKSQFKNMNFLAQCVYLNQAQNCYNAII